MSIWVIRPLEAVEYVGARVVAHLVDGRLVVDDHVGRSSVAFVPLGGVDMYHGLDRRCRVGIAAFAGPREMVNLTDGDKTLIQGYRLMLDRFTAAVDERVVDTGNRLAVWTSNVLGDWVDLPDGTTVSVDEWVGDVRL